MSIPNQLDPVLDKIVERCEIPGLGIGITESGEITYTYIQGVQSLDTQAPVSSASIFCLQSISKCFVASAMMQLVERGAIHLDDQIFHYLPYFKLDDKRYQKITLRHILSHTSGLPDMDEFEYNDLVAHPASDAMAAERFVRGLHELNLLHAPGRRFHYSNIGYDLLGDLLAKVSGITFEEYMKQNILLPAGMPDSTFLVADLDHDRVVLPHLRSPKLSVNPIYPYHRADAPSSFLHASIMDMCHWAIACLNQGQWEGNRILSPASFDAMWAPAVKRGASALREEMGLGWNLGHYHGIRTISHGGAGFGWTASFILLPEQTQGVIILCNEESSAIENVKLAVLETLLGGKPQAGQVSWMIPICHALEAGGIQAASSWYEDNRDRLPVEYVYNDYELIGLVFQLVGAGNADLAMKVLEFNLTAFPDSSESFIYLANLHLRKNQIPQTRECLTKALVIDPGDQRAQELMKRLG